MGFKLGKFLKKAVKLGAKLAKPVIATTPVGRLALRAQQTLKSLGGNLKAARLGKIEPLSVRASIEKVGVPRPASQIRSMPSTIRTAADFPGLRGSRRRRTSAKGSRMTQKRKTAAGAGRRVPPRGGLDLKAIAALWRAQGKPGTWISFIKANPIRKG